MARVSPRLRDVVDVWDGFSRVPKKRRVPVFSRNFVPFWTAPHVTVSRLHPSCFLFGLLAISLIRGSRSVNTPDRVHVNLLAYARIHTEISVILPQFEEGKKGSWMPLFVRRSVPKCRSRKPRTNILPVRVLAFSHTWTCFEFGLRESHRRRYRRRYRRLRQGRRVFRLARPPTALAIDLILPRRVVQVAARQLALLTAFASL